MQVCGILFMRICSVFCQGFDTTVLVMGRARAMLLESVPLLGLDGFWCHKDAL